MAALNAALADPDLYERDAISSRRTASLQARLMCFDDGAYMSMSGPGGPRSGKN
jgi:hypothetical protein